MQPLTASLLLPASLCDVNSGDENLGSPVLSSVPGRALLFGIGYHLLLQLH